MDAISEFADKIFQKVLKGLYDGLYAACEKQFNGMFDSMNVKVGEAANTLSQTPQTWNSTAYEMVKNIAENACIPIGGIIVAFVFCWELIHIMQESNNMEATKPDKIMLVLIKLCICIFVCAKSFDIVMGFYGIGQFVTQKIAGSTVGTFGEGLTIADIIPPVVDKYEFGMVFELMGNWLLLSIARIMVSACGVIVYIRVVMWFLELLMYSSVAPIPYGMFGNKEWSQVGLNYTRKMLALSFEGVFMLLAFALYGGAVSNLGNGGNFLDSIIMIIGSGVVLIMLLFKTGNISASVFNAH